MSKTVFFIWFLDMSRFIIIIVIILFILIYSYYLLQLYANILFD